MLDIIDAAFPLLPMPCILRRGPEDEYHCGFDWLGATDYLVSGRNRGYRMWTRSSL